MGFYTSRTYRFGVWSAGFANFRYSDFWGAVRLLVLVLVLVLDSNRIESNRIESRQTCSIETVFTPPWAVGGGVTRSAVELKYSKLRVGAASSTRVRLVDVFIKLLSGGFFVAGIGLH